MFNFKNSLRVIIAVVLAIILCVVLVANKAQKTEPPTAEEPNDAATAFEPEAVIREIYSMEDEFVPNWMKPNSRVTYDGDSVPTITQGGKMTAEDLIGNEYIAGLTYSDTPIEPYTIAEYDLHGFLQNIYYIINPDNFDEYRLSPPYRYVRIKPLYDENLNDYETDNYSTIYYIESSFSGELTASYISDHVSYRQYQIIFTYKQDENSGGYSCTLYIDPLSGKALLEKDGGVYQVDAQTAQFIHNLCVPPSISFDELSDDTLLDYGVMSDGWISEGVYYELAKRFESDPLGICTGISRFDESQQNRLCNGLVSEYIIEERAEELESILTSNSLLNHSLSPQVSMIIDKISDILGLNK